MNLTIDYLFIDNLLVLRDIIEEPTDGLANFYMSISNDIFICMGGVRGRHIRF